MAVRTFRGVLTFGLLAIAWPGLAAELSARDRAAVLNTTADLIDARYVLRDRASRVAKSLRKDAASDRWRSISDPQRFADAVSERLQEVSRDGHLALDFAPTAAAKEDTTEFNATEMEKWYGAHLNHGFERIERFPGNIGYLDLRVFAPNYMAGDVTAAAMTMLAQSDALIIDLRKNGGGSDTELMSAYLFDDGSKPLSGMYDRPTDTTTPAMTPAWVPGRRFGSKKPVYILTSKETFSAAEAFAYDLQALKRATLVGETTGGGANPFEYRPVGLGFYLSLSEQLSTNPITGKNWQDVGVSPDVRVPASKALDTALRLACEAIGKKEASSPCGRQPSP